MTSEWMGDILEAEPGTGTSLPLCRACTGSELLDARPWLMTEFGLLQSPSLGLLDRKRIMIMWRKNKTNTKKQQQNNGNIRARERVGKMRIKFTLG